MVMPCTWTSFVYEVIATTIEKYSKRKPKEQIKKKKSYSRYTWKNKCNQKKAELIFTEFINRNKNRLITRRLMLLFVYCCVIFFLTEYFWYFEMQLLYALLIQALCKDILHSPLTAKLKIPLKAQKVMWFFFFNVQEVTVSTSVCICMHGAENL